jgi:hypothetical protein
MSVDSLDIETPSLHTQFVANAGTTLPPLTAETVVVVEVDDDRFPLTAAIGWLSLHARELLQAHSTVLWGETRQLSDRQLLRFCQQGKVPGLMLLERAAPPPSLGRTPAAIYEHPPVVLREEDYERLMERVHSPESRDD